jgi:hypothetical protein
VQVDSHRRFNRQTLRQIVHTSVPGSRARIQISNLFGAQPLRIEDVHLAKWLATARRFFLVRIVGSFSADSLS